MGDNFDLTFPRQTPDTMVFLPSTYLPPSIANIDLMQISIAFWIKADVRYNQATVFTYRTLGKHSEMVEISYNDDKVYVLVQNDVLESPANILDQQWHFIGMSWGRYDEEFSSYFDGKRTGHMRISFEGKNPKFNMSFVKLYVFLK